VSPVQLSDGAAAARREARVVLVQALDVLMVRYDLDIVRANLLMSRISEQSGVSIAALARRVVQTAALHRLPYTAPS
jgi:hypothetical protein